MANYFDVTVACDLRRDTPPQVIDTLACMIRSEEYAFDNPPDHPFFTISSESAPDWKTILTEGSVKLSDRVPGTFGATLCSTMHESDEGPVGHAFSCRVHNIDYMFDTYMAFLDWLAPYAVSEYCFIGYYKWSDDEGPHLLYFVDGGLRGSPVIFPAMQELSVPSRHGEGWWFQEADE